MAVKLGDGGWSWFADPRAVYHAGSHRRTYVGWISRGGDVVVASFDHATRRIEHAVLHRDLGVDDHNNPGLLLRADGHLTAFYCKHNGGRMFYRRTLAAEDITAWGPEQLLAPTRVGRTATRIPTRCTSAASSASTCSSAAPPGGRRSRAAATAAPGRARRRCCACPASVRT